MLQSNYSNGLCLNSYGSGFFSLLQVREYLEKHYTDTCRRDTMKLAIKAISKYLEIAVVDRTTGLKFWSDEVDGLVADIDAEKTASDAARKQKAAQASGSS